MNIEIQWSKAIPLASGRRINLIYMIRDLDSLPTGPGVYVFGRLQAGRSFVPIYIGKAERVRSRVLGQLNNTRLMLGMHKEPRNKRLLVVGEYLGRPGPLANRAVKIVERALIEYALAQGYELLNQKGTKRPKHSIKSWGSRASRDWLPRMMSTPKA